MNLFQQGNFELHSGKRSFWKIECDALTDEDWETLALMAAERLPKFGAVIGVPTGGIKFAEALQKYVTLGCTTLLIADDVLTTGGSMLKLSEEFPDRYCLGVVAFARGRGPSWIMPLFRLINSE